MSTKQLKDYEFDELVNEATMAIHLCLLGNGGRAMREAIHMWMQQAILWNIEKTRVGKTKKGKK